MTETSNDNNKYSTIYNLNSTEMSSNTQIDFDNDRFPYSITWTPIPVIFKKLNSI